MIKVELYGEGGRVVKPLRTLAKGLIREQLALGGTDISRKVYALGLPRALGTYLKSLEWDWE